MSMMDWFLIASATAISAAITATTAAAVTPRLRPKSAQGKGIVSLF